MAEFFLLRTTGGPLDGQTRKVPRNFYGWPLPAELPYEQGRYVKTSESQLPAEVDESPHVARGAEYEWQASA